VDIGEDVDILNSLRFLPLAILVVGVGALVFQRRYAQHIQRFHSESWHFDRPIEWYLMTIRIVAIGTILLGLLALLGLLPSKGVS
jgi:hypothetical protein